MLPLCNLCRKNPADHENSHIFPRFMAVSLLENPGGKRVAHLTDNLDNPYPQKLQDSPKVPNILCKSCEHKIGEWESKFAKEFYYPFIKSPSRIDKTPGVAKPPRVVISKRIDYKNYKLVVYSMALRAAVSGHIAFSDLNLRVEHQELLRQIMNGEIPFFDLPTYTVTSESDSRYTENLIHANSVLSNTAMLCHNEFFFFIDFGNSEGVFNKFVDSKMYDGATTKIRVLPNKAWDDFRQLFVHLRAQKFNDQKRRSQLSEILKGLQLRSLNKNK
jgi:hypothetical protein